MQTAHNLDAMSVGMGGGYVTGLQSWDDLSVEPYQADSSSSEYNNSTPTSDADWYSFTLASEGLAGDYARIDYNEALGDLVLGLYEMENNTPTLITQGSTAQSLRGQISLRGSRADRPLPEKRGQRLRRGIGRGGHEPRLHAHAEHARSAAGRRLRDRSRQQHNRDRHENLGISRGRKPSPTRIIHSRFSPRAIWTFMNSRRKTRATRRIRFRSTTTRRPGRSRSSYLTRPATRFQARLPTRSAIPRRSA